MSTHQNRSPNPLKIVCLSDIHGQLPDISKYDYDLVIVAGDLCPHRPYKMRDFAPIGGAIDMTVQKEWLETRFIQWVNEAKAPVVAIAGNHDYCLVDGFSVISNPTEWFQSLSKNLVYLNCSSAIVKGVKIYGAPWTPYFLNWAFNFPEREVDYLEFATEMYSKIADDTNIVISHGPPLGILDRIEEVYGGTPVAKNVGCRVLKQRLKELTNLKLSVFGHIHSQYGTENGKWISVNAAVCNEKNNMTKPPILIEL